MADPQVGKSVVGSRTFTTVLELLWYNYSPVCGLSAGRLYGGAHTLHSAGLLQPEPLSPQQATADLCLCRRYSKAGLTQSLVRSLVPGAQKVSFEPSEDL